MVESEDFFEYNLTVAPERYRTNLGKQGRVAKQSGRSFYGVRTNGPQKVRLNIIDGK